MAQKLAVSLRPTVIVGLGGQGTRIAVALKARLEERFAEQTDYSYHNLIRFLCIDTSKESFEALRPNHPELGPVTITPEEMLRIGDLNLTDIRNSPDQSSLAALLPERLFGSQIYLGAQQIRRLGRVALLKHYDKVELKIHDAITTIMHNKNRGKLVGGAQISSEGRLRFFVICSVCGGTGSGTFIDVAYLIKDVAKRLVNAKCDVIGVFLLPEVLPEVTEGTGKARLRANAYASLLDLEYFNQDVPEGEILYTAPVSKPPEISGQPFDNAYLVQPGGKTTLRGMDEIAPIVADALDMMICTRLGEQLDATLDNVRHKFIDYHAGFRTFYSALGIAHYAYPQRWVQRQAALRLQNRLITDYLLGLTGAEGENVRPLDITGWWEEFQRDLRAVLDGNLDLISPPRRKTMSDDEVKLPLNIAALTKRLQTVERDLDSSRNPADDLRDAAEKVFEAFDRSYRSVKQQNQTVARRYSRAWIETALTERLHSGWEQQQGLEAALKWLLLLRHQIDLLLPTLLTGDQAYGDQAKAIRDAIQGVERVEALPFRLLNAQRAQAKREANRLRREINNEWPLWLTNRELYTTFFELRAYFDQLIGQVRDAIRFWKELIRPEESSRDFILAPTIEVVPSRESAGLDEAINRLFARRYQDVHLGVPPDLFPRHDFPEGVGEVLQPRQRPKLQQALEQWCDAARLTPANGAPNQADPSNVLDYLKDQMDWGKTLTEKAAPLLNYRSDILQTRKPVEIQILGVNNAAEVEPYLRDVDLSAFSKVETGDASQITVLNTSHAIPFNALAGFEEYHNTYRQLLNERNPIFHLNNELENAPFDPSFEQFINVYEFEGVFARALAYYWVWYNHTTNQYYLTDRLYQTLAQVVEEQLNEWERKKAEIGAKTDLPDYRRIENDYQESIEMLRSSLAALRDSQELEYVPNQGGPARSHIYPLRRPNGQPAVNLRDALEAIYFNPSPMFARLFERSVLRLEKDPQAGIRANAIEELLEKWQPNASTFQLPGTNAVGGANGAITPADERLLRRLLLQLKAYLTLKQKTGYKERYLWWNDDDTASSTFYYSNTEAEPK